MSRPKIRKKIQPEVGPCVMALLQHTSLAIEVTAVLALPRRCAASLKWSMLLRQSKLLQYWLCHADARQVSDLPDAAPSSPGLRPGLARFFTCQNRYDGEHATHDLERRSFFDNQRISLHAKGQLHPSESRARRLSKVPGGLSLVQCAVLEGVPR